MRSFIISPVKISVNWMRTSVFATRSSSPSVFSFTSTLSSVPPGSRVPSDGSKLRISRISLRRITNLKPTSYLPRLTSVSADSCASTTLNAPKSIPLTPDLVPSSASLSGLGHSTSTSMLYASALSSTGSVSTTPRTGSCGGSSVIPLW